MKRYLKFGLIIIIVGALLAIYPLYWKNSLDPVFESQSARVNPERFEVDSSFPTKLVNLGFIKFDVPEELPINPHMIGDSKSIALSVENEETNVIVFEPIRLELKSFGNLESIYNDDPPSSLWEFYTRSLNADIHSTWSVYFKGRNFLRRMGLELSMKHLIVGKADKVYIFENEDRGGIVKVHSDFIYVEIVEKVTGDSLTVWANGTIEDNKELISAFFLSAVFLTDIPQSYDTKSLGFPRLSMNTQPVAGGDATR